MDQGTAAEALGINKRTLQNIETTTGFYVSLRVIHRAARLYEVPAAWLQGKDDDKPEEKPRDEPVRREPSGDPSGPPPRPDRDRKGPPRVDNGLKAAS
jgi:transcriptional regulator with XRE-family HTH domain